MAPGGLGLRLLPGGPRGLLCRKTRLRRGEQLGIDLLDQTGRGPQLLCQGGFRGVPPLENLEPVVLPADGAMQLQISLFERGPGEGNDHDERESGAEAKEHGGKPRAKDCKPGAESSLQRLGFRQAAIRPIRRPAELRVSSLQAYQRHFTQLTFVVGLDYLRTARNLPPDSEYHMSPVVVSTR